MRLLLAVILTPTLAFAQSIYKWEDGSGTHYTDSPGSIPKTAARVERVQVEHEAAVAPASTVVVHTSNGRVWEDTGALNESQWRDRFVGAYQRIRTLEAAVASSEVNTLTVCPPYNPQPGAMNVQPPMNCVSGDVIERIRARVARQKIELSEARNDLDQLERNASIASVPREWRRGW